VNAQSQLMFQVGYPHHLELFFFVLCVLVTYC